MCPNLKSNESDMLRSSSTNCLAILPVEEMEEGAGENHIKRPLQPCQGMRVLQNIHLDKRALQPLSVQREIVLGIRQPLVQM